ncbi:MAG: transcriptional regulator [Oligoflexia bacterium]|nr:transcriptional regulator [Oligoflexia bacterium]
MWGVRDDDHEIVGTTFDPKAARKGNEELENWLLRLIRPRIDFALHEVDVDGKRVVLLEIDRAARTPVAFSGVEYVRVGSYTKKLKDHPEKERALWRIFECVPFEDGVAAERVTAEEVLRKLDYPAYFELLQLPLPDGRDAIMEGLLGERLVVPCEAGGFNITNLGAVLLARRLDAFPHLGRKALRVIQYKGTDRTVTLREQVVGKGYASGFEGLLQFIDGLLPTNEVVGQALRRDVPMFPPLAVRELVANALIHQDFSATGTGPMFELFTDRLEITNPGEPLVDKERLLDSPPTSRNEALASLMRRFGICEERGSGIDKVVAQVELFQLPPPLFEVPPKFTRAVLFSPRSLSKMDKDDRVRACYLHACLKHVRRDYLTNSSLRERFGIEYKNRAAASRLIRDAVEAGQIEPHDSGAAPRYMKYVPWWASATRREVP